MSNTTTQTIQALTSLNLNYQRDRILDVIATADTLSRFAEAGQGGEIHLDCESLDRMFTNICDTLEGVANYLSVIELAIPNPSQSHPNGHSNDSTDDYIDPYDQPAKEAKEEEERCFVRVCQGSTLDLYDFFDMLQSLTTVGRKRLIEELASGTGRFFELPKVTPPVLD